eukprot:Phypoly_transcript_12354.p1 GENE.Phypoly_transcript_12354~~Phypoly_transcript_12354.p1  ORF type:complete len:240 (-),score=41.79 Phypoly_transcript_12354:425-1144(-)
MLSLPPPFLTTLHSFSFLFFSFCCAVLCTVFEARRCVSCVFSTLHPSTSIPIIPLSSIVICSSLTTLVGFMPPPPMSKPCDFPTANDTTCGNRLNKKCISLHCSSHYHLIQTSDSSYKCSIHPEGPYNTELSHSQIEAIAVWNQLCVSTGTPTQNLDAFPNSSCSSLPIFSSPSYTPSSHKTPSIHNSFQNPTLHSPLSTLLPKSTSLPQSSPIHPFNTLPPHHPPTTHRPHTHTPTYT